MKVTIDANELRVFGDDLKRAAKLTDGKLMPIIAKGAGNIMRQLHKEMGASTHFRGITRAITFDLYAGIGAVWAEIGPVKGAPGSLANIAYFGSSRGGGTVPDPRGALEVEAPNVEKYIGELVERALR